MRTSVRTRPPTSLGPIMVFSLLAAAVVAAPALAYALSRRRSQRSGVPTAGWQGESLSEAYPPSDPSATAVGLVSPPGPRGLIAVHAEGLDLHLGEGAPDFRRVPWDAVRGMGPGLGGGARVHVSGVGPVEVPASIVREIWGARGGRAL